VVRVKTEDYLCESGLARGLDCIGYGAGLHFPLSQAQPVSTQFAVFLQQDEIIELIAFIVNAL
jgi:hypothetical protein